jgi:hypothetical protein
MLEWDMDNREQLLSAVRISRDATTKLSSLMQKTPLDAGKIQRCIERGALVEEAFHEHKGERHHDTRRIHAIEMALRADREDIVEMFFKAPGLDGDARKSWLQDAVERDATKSAIALIGMGAMNWLDDDGRNQFVSLALGRGNATLVDAALKAGCNPNGMVETIMERKEPLLHQVRDTQSLDVMLAGGARIDGQDTWGRPALHNVLDRLSYYIKDAKRQEDAKDYIQTAHALLDAGVAVSFIAASEGTRSWNAIEDLTQARTCDASLVARIAKMNPNAARNAQVRNIEAAHYLINSGVIEDLGQLRKKIYWEGISLYDEKDVRAVESLLERGVPPPSIFQIGGSSHRKWLEIGIVVTEDHIERKLMQVEQDEENEIFANWNGLQDPALIAASNMAAAARALRIRTQPAAGGRQGSGPRL